jgi:hypothetical protein
MNLMRERGRFLRKAAVHLKPHDQERLVTAILAGPRRPLYRESLPEDDFRKIADHEIWRNLAQLRESGTQLPQAAQEKLAELERETNWRLAPDESDEFPIWLGGSDKWERSSGSFVERLRQLTPEEAADLLATEKSARIDLMDAFRTLCEDKPPTHALSIMRSLVAKKIYEPEIWRMAFSVFWGRPEPEWQPEVWGYLLEIIPGLTNELCSSINNTLSGWLSVLAKHLSMEEEPKFWSTWTRLWSLRPEVVGEGLSNRPVYAALNHPSGQLAEAALTRLFERKLSKDDGIPAELKTYFDSIATAEDTGGVLGRVILCSRLNNLFLLDRAWTSDKLIPKLEWRSPEAPALWEGYLWAPRCSPELLAAFKKSFLETVARSDEFGEHSTNLRRLFALACIYNDGAFTLQEMRKAIHGFDSNGLADTLALFSDLLRGAGEKALTLWSDRIGPWLKNNWPTTKEKQSGRTSLRAAEMAINSHDAFPLIAEWALDFLLPSEHVDQLLWRLGESDLAERYPSIVLRVLSKLVPDNAESWEYHGLREILQKISSTSPELSIDSTYKRLHALAQKVA